jgi:hypothetical protein
VDHISLDGLSTTRIEYELAGVETELVSLGIPAPKVTPPPSAQLLSASPL